ncbi:uncharacterized protein [Onthophagus taurus]|uniref:uncharacterized protein n=1 Tax=Onthophagus taurus TaxID=166361 RepID=UPI0039BDEDC9
MDSISENVKKAIESVIKIENFTTYPSVTITSGSLNGDGLTSKTVAVNLKNDQKSVDVFIKYFPENATSNQINLFKDIYETETRFYEKVYPVMVKFQKERKLRDGFDNVARYYPCNNVDFNGIAPIALSNLRAVGYGMRDLKEEANQELLVKVLETYAKLHATFLAMKDQQPEVYKSISSELVDDVAEKFNDVGFYDVIKVLMKGLIDYLDPKVDKIAIEKLTEFLNNLETFVSDIPKLITNDYSIITHADGWSNNMMFLYNESKRLIDVKILDWQVYKISFPGLEATHVFYNALARKKALDNVEIYTDAYYNKLKEQVEKLGSDVNKLYPKEVFLAHWKQFAKYGMMLAIVTNRVAFMSKDDIVDLVDNKDGKMPIFSVDFKEKDRYFKLLKDLVDHFVQNDLF